MKFKFIITTIAVLAFCGVQVAAQTADEIRVKILPSTVPGIIKLHYAQEVSEPLQINFLADNGVVHSDIIKGGPYLTGLSKRYDVRNIQQRDFWMVISSSYMTVTYHLARSGDRKKVTPRLEQIRYHQPLVKGNQ